MAPNTEDAEINSTSDLSDEELRKLFKPSVAEEQAKEVILKNYAKEGQSVEVLKQLDSYDDANFMVKLDGDLFLLKVHNGVESKDFLKVYEAAGNDYFKKGSMNSVVHFQSTIMALLSANGIKTSVPQMANGTNIPVSIEPLPVVSEDHSPQRLVVRLLGWVDGTLMSEADPMPVECLADAGRYLGQLDKVLDKLSLAAIQPAEKGPPDEQHMKDTVGSWVKFDSQHVPIDASILEPARRFHQWDGKNTAQLRSFTSCITDERRRQMIVSILNEFQSSILDSGDSKQFRQGVSHADFNDANILIDDSFRVSGVIDFGDSVESWRVLDVTVAMAYAMLSTYGKTNRAISAAAAVLRGYTLVYPLTPLERKHLVLLIACRLACSVTLGAYSYQQNPENKYLLFHAEPAWKTLEMFWCHDLPRRKSVQKAFARVLNQACLHHGTNKPGSVIPCSDLVFPDPTTVDLLADVRLSSIAKEPTEEATSPPAKKMKTDLPVITFVTGNSKKLAELERILVSDESAKLPFQLTNQKVDLPELQGDPIDIAKEKCSLAAEKVGGPVITEDTSLCFNALNGMPGPYIKWFLESCGLDGLNQLLAGFDDKTAYAMTVVAYSDGPGETPAVFCGKTNGKIVMPRGRLDFGWDPIFQPEDGTGDKTYGEMEKEEKDSISHRSRALAQMRAFFQSPENPFQKKLNGS